MPEPIQTVAFVVNTQKPRAPLIARRLSDLARSCGRRCVMLEQYPILPGKLAGADLCCTIGGDGTLLGVVPEVVRARVPVMGINTGNLGFLTTDYEESALCEGFLEVLEGRYYKESRALLCCKSVKGKRGLALNDVVIRCSPTFRLGHFEVFADGKALGIIDGDGLIISTPTGSTAYNLSAGGPLVHPQAQVMILTPICSHRLANRSLVLPPSTCLTICEDKESSSPKISLDGKPFGQKFSSVSVASETIDLICAPNYDYFSLLRHKLNRF